VKLKTKVVVVGGGPAGAIAARSLAEYGVDVIVLERNPSFKKPCGGAISLIALEELHIPETVIGKEVKCIRIVSPKGEKLDVELGEGTNLWPMLKGKRLKYVLNISLLLTV
jgi:geranylgeranyl reductase